MKLNDLNLSEIISLCKSEITKLGTSKETCIKLYELIQNLKSSEDISEMEKPRKFNFVSERGIKELHPELTLCNPELIMTLLNHCQDSVSNAEMLFLYNSDSDSSKSMKRSQAKINLIQEPEGDSVISTAEEHQITCLKVDVDLKRLKPKSQSSTTSLLPVKLDKSMTFNVDVASTPKKVFQRSSTIRRAIRKQPLTSTMIKPEIKKLRIPPPLLSSSIVPEVKELKRKRSGSLRKSKKSKIQRCCKNCERKNSDLPLNIKTLKYPIKFCPNMKTKDIDRMSVFDQLNSLGYENNLKPSNNKNCYGYGDYNVWFL